ncbi:MAG: LysM peptidoglycan-binding domain-containing protein [Duncaniella sp.]|nr:LysM peptidoglycan-binding domain-containing protein [Duncaniella sp.]
MNFSRLSAIASILFASASILLSAGVRDLPVKTVGGKSYYYYEVPVKETVYSLTHKLGVTKDEIIRHNPSVADGLKSGTTLYFPVDEGTDISSSSDVTNSGGSRTITHNVEKGQTIYGIATKYGISTDKLIEQNPIVREGLKTGQVLHITIPGHSAPDTSAASSTLATTPASTDLKASGEVKGYIVKKKETFYSIARAHGISVAQLEAANPNVSILKEGQVLNIPNPITTEELAEHNTVSDSVPGQNQIDPDTTLSIAVILPFMLNEETPSKSAQRYTEFYKGMLLAVDSLRNNGTPIHISAYDSEGSLDKVKELLTLPELKNNRIIIAPDNVAQLTAIGEFGRNNNIKVFNTFIVKDESYKVNPEMMQGNLPSSKMYEKAVQSYTERMAYSYPVFISMASSSSDKADFIADLKKSLNEKGITYSDITVDTKLTPAELKQLPTKDAYTFIPTSSKQGDLNKIMPGIIEWRDEAVTASVKLLGYPEWTTFRGETLTNMKNLNTIVYSRFYTDDDNLRARSLENKYKKWYGSNMESAVPRQGLLGFDTGMFLIKYLKYPAARYDGIQNGYSFVSPEGIDGYFNDVLYLVNFRPGGLIEKINL